MLLSANAPNGFDGRSEPTDKLTGIQLSHFGAFYKRSWRANDWMWGRLDAAYHLTRTLLDPAKLRKLHSAERAAKKIRSIALGPLDSPAYPVLAAGADDRFAEVLDELRYIDDPTEHTRESLPKSTMWIARRIQLEILRKELGSVAAAVFSDEKVGGARRPSARYFVDRFLEEMGLSPSDDVLSIVEERLTAEGSAGTRDVCLPPEGAISVFRACRVGRELLVDESRTDLFTETVTTAGAVAVSAGGGTKGGLGPVRGLFASVRGLMLTLSFLTRNALEGSKAGFASMALIVFAAAFFTAFGLVTNVRPPGLLRVVAFLALVAAAVLAALRSRWPGVLLSLIVVGLALIGVVVSLFSRPGSSLAVLGLTAFGAIALVTGLQTGLRGVVSGKAWTVLGVVILLAGLVLYAGWPPIHVRNEAGVRYSCGSPVIEIFGKPLPGPTASGTAGGTSSPSALLTSPGPSVETCASVQAEWRGRSMALLLLLGGVGLMLAGPRPRQFAMTNVRPAGESFSAFVFVSPSKVAQQIIFMVSIVLAAAALATSALWDDAPGWVDLAAILVAMLLGLVAVWLLVDRFHHRHVALYQGGVELRTGRRTSVVPWQSIAGISTTEVGGKPFLRLSLAGSRQPRSRLTGS